jgi:hypothetical protein
MRGHLFSAGAYHRRCVSWNPASCVRFTFHEKQCYSASETQATLIKLQEKSNDSLLDDALMAILSSDRGLDGDRARLLRERSVDVFGIAEESLQRCLSFTHGYSAVGLVQALDSLFRSFVGIWTADITHARRTAYASKPRPPALSTGDLEDLDYTDEDWAEFQLSLHPLASARSVYERMTISKQS